MARLGLTRIGHVALKVADLERSLHFYRDQMGFEEMLRLDHADGSLMLVYLRSPTRSSSNSSQTGRVIARPAASKPPFTISAWRPTIWKPPRPRCANGASR